MKTYYIRVKDASTGEVFRASSRATFPAATTLWVQEINRAARSQRVIVPVTGGMPVRNTTHAQVIIGTQLIEFQRRDT